MGDPGWFQIRVTVTEERRLTGYRCIECVQFFGSVANGHIRLWGDSANCSKKSRIIQASKHSNRMILCEDKFIYIAVKV